MGKDKPATNSTMQRVVSYLVDKVLVEGLSNSRLFQRFVVHTNNKLGKTTQKMESKFQDFHEKKFAEKIVEEPAQPDNSLRGAFSETIREEFQSIFGKGKGK